MSRRSRAAERKLTYNRFVSAQRLDRRGADLAELIMRKTLFCATLAIALSAGGQAFAQRRAPSERHAVAVPRHTVSLPRQSVTIHSRIAAPVFVGSRSYRVYRPPFYRPYYGHRSFGFGLYIGSPYAWSPYAYPAYSYPYYGYPYYDYYDSYPYTVYPPVTVYPNAGVGSLSVAPPPAVSVPQAQAPEPPTLPNEDNGVAVMPARGFIAIDGAPADATIYVDGNYAGHATDFGAQQPLSEPAGAHQVEIRTPGRRPVLVHVDVQPGRVLSYTYPPQE
jgi:hypothetical protein